MRHFYVQILTALSVLALSSGALRAEQRKYPGKTLTYIEPTSPWDLLSHGGRVGFSSSPSTEGDEIKSALDEFSDRAAAIRQIEKLKREKKAGGGTLFAGFTIASGGRMELLCGISPAKTGNWSDVRGEMTVYTTAPATPPFRGFKYSTRAERVRTIARCLTELPGMPPLRRTRPRIQGLYIDADSYELAKLWLRRFDPYGYEGSDEQYKTAFRCLATAAASRIPHAVEGHVVIRSFKLGSGYNAHPKRGAPPGPTRPHDAFIVAVASDEAAKEIYDSDPILTGLWPTRVTIDGLDQNEADNPLEQLFGKFPKSEVDRCRRHARLFELPRFDRIQAILDRRVTCSLQIELSIDELTKTKIENETGRANAEGLVRLIEHLSGKRDSPYPSDAEGSD